MGRRSKVQRSAEEKFAIVLEGLKTGNVSETCRNYEVSPTLFYRWKDETEKGALAALGGEAQPRGPMKTRPSASSKWSGRWAAAICRSRYKKRAGQRAAGKLIRRRGSSWPGAAK